MEHAASLPNHASPGMIPETGATGLTARLPHSVWGPWAVIGWVVLAILAWMLVQLPFALFMNPATSSQAGSGDVHAVLRANAGVLLAATAVGQMVFVVAAVLLALPNRVLEQLRLDRGPPRGLVDYAFAFALCFAVGAAINVFRQYVLGHDIYADLKQLGFLFRNPLWPLSFLAVAVLAPIAEELLFRGVMLPALAHTRLKFWGAAVVTTLAWTLLHMGNAYSLAGMLLVFTLGMIFSWLYARTGSLRVPIVVHMLNNTIACVLLQTGWV